MFEFNFDDVVRDEVTGLEGKITARTEWRNGCIRYQVEKLAGDEVKEHWFDEDRLELVTAATETREFAERTGGGRPAPPRSTS
jgi:hypothetical protein